MLATISPATSDPTFALALAVVVAGVYLIALRLIDLNEKEPLWSIGLVLGLGALGSLVLSVLVHARTLHGTTVLASVADELTIFITLAIGIGILEGIGRLRGWSEVNGLVDGAVYGAAAGLGFATGDAFIQGLQNSGSILSTALGSTPLDTLWPTLLAGLAFGVFGALLGAGFGAAIDRPSVLHRIGLPLLGLALAFGVQAVYLAVAHGNPLGSSGKLREWLVLVAPVVLFLALMLFGLASERDAIANDLSADGVEATTDELALLRNPVARRAAYIRCLAGVDARGWLGLRSLQNRQVQLALTRRRAGRATDPHIKTQLDHEVTRLRAAIVAARQHPGAPDSPMLAERPS